MRPVYNPSRWLHAKVISVILTNRDKVGGKSYAPSFTGDRFQMSVSTRPRNSYGLLCAIHDIAGVEEIVNQVRVKPQPEAQLSFLNLLFAGKSKRKGYFLIALP